MKTAILALFSLVTASSAFAGPVFDVCNKQIKDYVSSQLGTTVTQIWYDNGADSNKPLTAWVSVASCGGSYVFHLNASESTCKQAHYGRIPNYIQVVYADGACAGKTTEPTETVDVCENQIRDYAKTQLDTTVTQISMIDKDADHGQGAEAWVKTPKCDGYFVFNLSASSAECKGKHYGRIPNYISNVWEYGACRKGSSEEDEKSVSNIPTCDVGFMPVPHYSLRFEFQGYVCERDPSYGGN